jgi:hypothetical protein
VGAQQWPQRLISLALNLKVNIKSQFFSKVFDWAVRVLQGEVREIALKSMGYIFLWAFMKMLSG